MIWVIIWLINNYNDEDINNSNKRSCDGKSAEKYKIEDEALFCSMSMDQNLRGFQHSAMM